MGVKVERVQQETPEDPEFIFECPGCGVGHWFKTTGSTPKWTWNGDFEKPTITPSIDVAKDDPAHHCHSYVTDGRIIFLKDCHHGLRGQTVPLPDID